MKISLDKWLHAVACFTVAMIAGLVTLAISDEHLTAAIVGFALAMAVGIGKEVYDKYKGGTGFDWHDIAADAVGAAFGFVGVMVS